MSLADCLKKMPLFGKEDTDLMNSYIEDFKKKGYDQDSAERMAVREYGKTLQNESENLHRSLGLDIDQASAKDKDIESVYFSKPKESKPKKKSVKQKATPKKEEESPRFKRTTSAKDNFYSNSINSLVSIPMEKATSDQWKSMMLKNGSSKHELEWMGFDDFLANNQKPTKQEVLDFISSNQIEIKEVEKGDVKDSKYIEKQEAKDMFDKGGEIFGIDDQGIEALIESVDDFNNFSRFALDQDFPTTNATKYSDYQLEGGKNYKELLLTTPSIREKSEVIQDSDGKWWLSHATGNKSTFSYSSKEFAEKALKEYQERESKGNVKSPETYKSSHWDEPNILAHIRHNERTDSEGNKVLFLEEVQSDWAQDGRKKGFKINDYQDQLKKAQDEYDKLDFVNLSLSEIGETPEARKLGELQKMEFSGIPNMPFKQTSQWINLSMKRMIRHAAENGFDKVAWVTGEQSAERYDLSKQINSLEYDFSDNSLVAYNTDGDQVIGKTVPESELEATIGKEATQKILDKKDKIIAEKGETENDHTTAVLENQDLKVGGEGMKSFYNKILPSTVSKLLKKFDKTAKVEVSKINGKDQLSFPITPALRQKSIQEGFPMFKKQVVTEEQPSKRKEWLSEQYRRYVDMFADLQRMQENKVAEGGLLEDEFNAYQKETLSHSKITVQQEKFGEKIWKPLVDHIKSIHKETGFKKDDISQYLKAKHALERNIKMRKDKGVGDDAVFGGMEDADAKAIIENFESKTEGDQLSELHKMVKDVNQFTLDKQLTSGIISDGDHEVMSSMYEFYVPLRGYSAVDNDPTVFSGKKAAKGRKSESGDPLAYMIAMANTAIIQGEQNVVKKALLDYVIANPDNTQYTVKDVWFVNTGDVDADGKQVWEEKIHKPSKEEFAKGLVTKSYNPDKQVLIESSFTKENVTALVDGKKVSIEFIGEGVRVAQAFKKMNVDKTPKFLQWMGGYMSWLRGAYTMYSPEFVIRNLIRDMTAGTLNIRNDYGNKVAGRALKNLTPSMKAIWSINKGAEPLIPSKHQKYYMEYRDAGGMTGYTEMKDIQQHQKELQATIDGLGTKLGKNFTWTKAMLTKTFKPVDDVNRMFENGMRLSSFVTLRDQGMSIDQAAVYAKELTVNFNKKGNWSSAIGNLYLFFNASVQGTVRILQPFNSIDKNVRKRAIHTAMMLPSLAIMQGVIGRLMGGEDEDGEYFYDKLPDHVRTHNIVIPNMISDKQGDFIQIPLPYGFNFFTAAGEHTLNTLLGKEEPTKSAMKLASSALGSFSPLGSPDLADEDTEWYEKAARFMPTITQPLTDLMTNKNFAGMPIYKKPFMNGETERPDSQMYMSNVNPLFRDITEALNSATGGDEVTAGGIDINPETLEHIAGTYGGGIFQFVNNSATSALMVMDGKNPFSFEEDRYKKIPFLRNYLGSPSINSNGHKFYERLNELKDVSTILKRYEKLGDRKRTNEYKKEHVKEIRLIERAKLVEKKAKDIRNKRKRLENMPMTDAIENRIQTLKKQEQDVFKAFNKRFSENEINLSELIGKGNG